LDAIALGRHRHEFHVEAGMRMAQQHRHMLGLP
jgi:hypothetical protein